MLIVIVFSASGLLKNDVEDAKVWLSANTHHVEHIDDSIWISRVNFNGTRLPSFNIASSARDLMVVGDEVWLPGLTRKRPRQWPKWKKG